MLSSYRSALRALGIPLGLLLAAELSLPQLQTLPQEYRALVPLLPYATGLLPLVVALVLNQARIFIIAVLVLLCYWCLDVVRTGFVGDAFARAAIFSAAGILFPLNLALFGRLPERPALSVYGVARYIFIGLQVALVAWLITARRTDILQWVTQPFLPLSIDGLRLPHAAVASLMFAALLQFQKAWREQSPLGGGLLIVLMAAAIACNRLDTPAVPEAFLAAAALVLLATIVLHTHHIAYRDELTGLPGRRALQERMASLGRRYTLAMLDVDHFKKFNDTYGHDVGDQVLKMVAAQIRRVGGGGKAFRYGGEEFTIVFPGKREEQALPHLDEVRKAVAGYKMMLRGHNRPSSGKAGRRKRGHVKSDRSVSVTISIGLAARDGEARRTDQVLKAADEALYRAKKAGRNRVSH